MSICTQFKNLMKRTYTESVYL